MSYEAVYFLAYYKSNKIKITMKEILSFVLESIMISNSFLKFAV